jgi:hypothetical protein
MKSSWIELIKAFGPIIGALISLLGFIFLIRQIRLNRLSLENQTRSSIYQLSYNVYRLFIEHPDLRPYFYDGKALPESEPERSKVLAAAELLTDFFESIVHSSHIIDPDLRGTWFRYMQDTYRHNPVFQDYIETRGDHYTKVLHKAIGSNKKGGGGLGSLASLSRGNH